MRICLCYSCVWFLNHHIGVCVCVFEYPDYALTCNQLKLIRLIDVDNK